MNELENRLQWLVIVFQNKKYTILTIALFIIEYHKHSVRVVDFGSGKWEILYLFHLIVNLNFSGFSFILYFTVAWNAFDLLNTKQKYTETRYDIQNNTYHKWISQEKKLTQAFVFLNKQKINEKEGFSLIHTCIFTVHQDHAYFMYIQK